MWCLCCVNSPRRSKRARTQDRATYSLPISRVLYTALNQMLIRNGLKGMEFKPPISLNEEIFRGGLLSSEVVVLWPFSGSCRPVRDMLQDVKPALLPRLALWWQWEWRAGDKVREFPSGLMIVQTLLLGGCHVWLLQNRLRTFVQIAKSQN